MVETYAVLQVAGGVLHCGVAAMVGLQIQAVALPVGDAGVIGVVGEKTKLGAGGLHPADDETHRYGVGLILEGSVRGFDHNGGAFHPAGDGRPLRLWYGRDETPNRACWPTVVE